MRIQTITDATLAFVAMGAATGLLHCASADDSNGGDQAAYGDACANGSECASGLECVVIDPLVGSVCSNACSEGNDFECPVGSRCVASGSGFYCAQTSGGGNSGGGVGDACNDSGDCNGELQCYEPSQGAERFCVQTCDTAAPDCPAGQACVAINAEVGYCDDVGVSNGGTSNGTSNGTTGTSNSTTDTSNGTTSTSNGTTGTSNGTTSTSNGTTSTSNGTTGTSNGTTGVDPCDGITCDPGEVCVEGRCEPGQESCMAVDQPCSLNTLDTAELLCLAADNTEPELLSCRPVCTTDEDCAEGSFCGTVGDATQTVCVPSNCSSVFDSDTECSGLENGGTCLAQANGAFICIPGGTRGLGIPCTNELQCQAGLVCGNEACANPCELGTDSCGVDEECAEVAGLSEPGVGACVPFERCEAVGSDCSGSSEDTETLVCAAGDPRSPMTLTCLTACDVANPSCTPDTTCVTLARDGGANVAACVASNCLSPLQPQTCAAVGPNGGHCLPTDDGILRCSPAGTVMTGGVCAETEDCAPGLGCNNEGVCRPLCDVTNPIQCGGEVCEPLLGGFGTCAPSDCEPACANGQLCFQGQCVAESTCQVEGQPCVAGSDTALLVCLEGDDLRPGETTCHRTCNTQLGDCALGSLCIALEGQETQGACLRSNCSSPLEPEACADLGGNGGNCLPVGNGTFRCLAAGSDPEGSACLTEATCQPGLGCLVGECTPYCATANPMCPGQEGCVPIFLDSDVYGLCGEGCLGWEGGPGLCPDGQGCQPFSQDEGICIDVGPRAEGEACNAQLSTELCGEFLTCADFGSVGATCRPWCNLTSPLAEADASCGADALCIEAFEGLAGVVGLCWPSCTPYEGEATNGCEIEGFRTCLPERGGTAGSCAASGISGPGEACLRQDSIFGDCQGGYACDSDDPDALIGLCEPLCRPFAAQMGTVSGCPAGEVCGIFTEDWGVCSDDVLPGTPAAGTACTTPGTWCSEDTLCFQVGDAPTDGLCLQFCRLGRGNADCPGLETCETALESEIFGVCL